MLPALPWPPLSRETKLGRRGGGGGRGILKPPLLIEETAEDKWLSQPFPNEVSLPLSPHGSLGLFHSPSPTESWQC